MFKALLLKHLKQARIVVVTGMAFTLAIPLLAGLLVGVVWGGQTPVGRNFLSAGWGAALMAGFWPLWMMLITLQIFAGDQACGADNFLRERPIRPCTLWWSRTVASFLAFGVFFLISFLGWWLGAQILGGQSHTTISDNMGYMLKIGAAFLPLVFAAGALAAACGLSGFSGLYLAAALTGAPYLVVILAEKWVRSLGLDLHPLVVLGARRQPLLWSMASPLSRCRRKENLWAAGNSAGAVWSSEPDGS